MDYRMRRYWAVKLPSGYTHNELIHIIKSMPHVKVHPAKWPPVKMSYFTDRLHRKFEDEESERRYYNIMVSVWGWYETKALLHMLTGFAAGEFNKRLSYWEILPRGGKKSRS